MTSPITIRIDMTKCRELRQELKPRGAAIVKKAAFDVEGGAKDRAPVKTGFLKNSIATEFENGGLQATIGPAAEYGIYVELGTKRMRARPYLKPAFERVRAGFIRAWESLVK